MLWAVLATGDHGDVTLVAGRWWLGVDGWGWWLGIGGWGS